MVDEQDQIIETSVDQEFTDHNLKIETMSVMSEVTETASQVGPEVNVSSGLSDAPYSAGIPVLEIIRKLDDDKLFTKHDKLSFQEAYNDPAKREKILKALRDYELGTNKRFAVRRLKAIIHQNGSGEPTSRVVNQTLSAFKESHDHEEDLHLNVTDKLVASDQPATIDHNNFQDKKNALRTHTEESDDDNDMSVLTTPKTTIIKVVGESPAYAGTGSDTLCNKIAARIKEFFIEYHRSKIGSRKFGIIVGQGSFNPLTRMHMRTYFLAKQELESRHGYIILGSLLSPAHGVSVRERYRTNTSEIIPSPHRLAIAQLMVQDSKWLTIDPWEITRRRTMDYLALLDHVSDVVKQQFTDVDIRIIYLCKPNVVPKLSPEGLKTKGYNVVSVCRAPESDVLRNSLGSKWNGVIHVVEDSAILDTSMDVVTSRWVREKMKKGESIDQLVGDVVNNYVSVNRIGIKMNGVEDWEESEKILPIMPSRNLSNLQLKPNEEPQKAAPSTYYPYVRASTEVEITEASTASLIEEKIREAQLHEKRSPPKQRILQKDPVKPSNSSLPAIGVKQNNSTNDQPSMPLPSTSLPSIDLTRSNSEQQPTNSSTSKIEVTAPALSPLKIGRENSTNKNNSPIKSNHPNGLNSPGISSMLKITSPLSKSGKTFINHQVEENKSVRLQASTENHN